MYTINDAILVAAVAHKDQKDKVGEPYILHPLRVMLGCHDSVARMTAALHDVIEDTDLTDEALRVLGVPLEVIEAVVAMSKIRGESYRAYLIRVKANDVARRVKIADLTDNMSPARLYQLDHGTRERLERKYIEALKFLEG